MVNKHRAAASGRLCWSIILNSGHDTLNSDGRTDSDGRALGIILLLLLLLSHHVMADGSIVIAIVGFPPHLQATAGTALNYCSRYCIIVLLSCCGIIIYLFSCLFVCLLLHASWLHHSITAARDACSQHHLTASEEEEEEETDVAFKAVRRCVMLPNANANL